MEGCGGDLTSPARNCHHLPRLPTCIRAVRGTGTATLEAKLLQQLAAMREEVLYVIFLDLHKAYDALDKSRSLDILEGYGFGPRARRLLRAYWEKSTMVARAGGILRDWF